MHNMHGYIKEYHGLEESCICKVWPTSIAVTSLTLSTLAKNVLMYSEAVAVGAEIQWSDIVHRILTAVIANKVCRRCCRIVLFMPSFVVVPGLRGTPRFKSAAPDHCRRFASDNSPTFEITRSYTETKTIVLQPSMRWHNMFRHGILTFWRCAETLDDIDQLALPFFRSYGRAVRSYGVCMLILFSTSKTVTSWNSHTYPYKLLWNSFPIILLHISCLCRLIEFLW